MAPVPVAPPVPIAIVLTLGLLLRATTAIAAVPLRALRVALAAAITAAFAPAFSPATAPPPAPAPASALSGLSIGALLAGLRRGVVDLGSVAFLVRLLFLFFLLDIVVVVGGLVGIGRVGVG